MVSPVDYMRAHYNSALDQQAGGEHYRHFVIQPVEYCQNNRLDFCESNVIKYVSRHRKKNGVEDVDKAIHMLLMLRELVYPDAEPCRFARCDETSNERAKEDNFDWPESYAQK